MTAPQKRRALALLACLAILFCVFAFHTSPLHWTLPLPVCAALIALVASAHAEDSEDRGIQPLALISIRSSRAPPAIR
ncbi:MAG TPA: hypothetical protein VHC72_14680 [Bryobacteraceae bacterium]|nr:hypothetical protein [Bryobacteraceae bacterium]